MTCLTSLSLTGDHRSTIVRLFFSMKNHTKNTKRSLSRSIFVSSAYNLSDGPSILGTTPEDISEVVLQVNSPSNKKRALLRKRSDKIDGFSRYVEIWTDGILEASVDVSDLHGDFYSDGKLCMCDKVSVFTTFTPEILGSLAFAPSELALVYVAESTDGIKKEDDPYRKYRYNPDFGECLGGVQDPAIFYFCWSPSTPPTILQLKPVGFENVRFGQPIFDPKSSSILYATGYELTMDGKFLGINYCFNRPSGIWRLQIPDVSTGKSDMSKFAVLDTCAVKKLTPSQLSCRSPRVLRVDGRSVLVWLACTSGGPHVSTSTLHSLNISLLDEPDEQSIIESDKPLLDFIKDPLNDLSCFPGLYPSYNLPISPFVISESDNQPFVLVHSQWGSRTTVLQISLKDGVVYDLTPDAEGKLYSWVVLATDGNKTFICSRSAPNVPYEILLGQLKENGAVNWLLLDKPILRKEGIQNNDIVH